MKLIGYGICKTMGIGRLLFLVTIAGGVCGHALSAFAESVPAAGDPNAVQVSAEEPAVELWMVASQWKRLREQMSPQEVVDLLGLPKFKEESPTVCTWYYQDVPVLLDSGAVQRPRLGLVTLKRLILDGRECHTVRSWKEPNWIETPERSLAEYRRQQNRLEQARRQAEAEQRRRQELARRIEERRQREVQTAPSHPGERKEVKIEEAPEPPAAGQREDRDLKYWYIGGGAMGGMLLAALIFRGIAR